MSAPLISVVIPTTGRSDLLCRSVSTAVSGLSDKEVEVIVVPNGPATDWLAAKERFHNDRRVKFVPIPQLCGNTARNAGLEFSVGKLIRFLDDDDYLHPDAAAAQYRLAIDSEADICSGNAEILTDKGRRLGLWEQPQTNDYCVGVVRSDRNSLPFCHVIKRSVIDKLRWNPDDFIRQDVLWLLDIAKETEIKWERINLTIGAWVQHSSPRVSTGGLRAGRTILSVPDRVVQRDRVLAERLLQTFCRLEADCRLNEARREALATALWSCVHTAYYADPPYWKDIAAKAHAISSISRPPFRLYSWPLIRNIDPIALQPVFSWKRRFNSWIRYLKRTRV